jgi:alkaline phosphatase D
MTDNKNTLSRRAILKSIPAGAAATIAVAGTSSIANAQEATKVSYNHGVASGDPLQDRVIIWTRVTPGMNNHNGIIHINWEVATDKGFSNVVSKGHIHTGQGSDYTAKADATGLEPGQDYFYRFKVRDQISPIGETRTLNEKGMKQVRLAVVSCSNYPFGYFNAYKALCDNGQFDAVLHLGDYIYDYQIGEYQSPNAEKMGRLVDPPHEIVTLSDYRTRYAQYRTDEDLQEIHRRYPFICAWDDHEFANDAYSTGAQNHNAGEGDWHTRRASATQAYFEWLPIREQQMFVSFRSFEFGDLATLAMLDTRVIGRERGLTYKEDVDWLRTAVDNGLGSKTTVPVAYDAMGNEVTDAKTLRDLTEDTLPKGWQYRKDYEAFHTRLKTEERSMLGAPQEKWLKATLKKSKKANVPWQILGQQVIMSYQERPPVSSVYTDKEIAASSDADKASWKKYDGLGFQYNPDAWDGYQPARKRVLDMLEEHTHNSVVLAGDTHCAWAHSLCHEMGGKHYGAEFAVQGITSPGYGDSAMHADELAQKYRDMNDHMAFSSLSGRGYMTVTFTEKHATANWYVVSDIESKDFTVSHRKSLRFNAGDGDDGKITLEDLSSS